MRERSLTSTLDGCHNRENQAASPHVGRFAVKMTARQKSNAAKKAAAKSSLMNQHRVDFRRNIVGDTTVWLGGLDTKPSSLPPPFTTCTCPWNANLLIIQDLSAATTNLRSSKHKLLAPAVLTAVLHGLRVSTPIIFVSGWCFVGQACNGDTATC